MTQHQSDLQININKIIVALDVFNIDKANSLISELREHVIFFKIGLELFYTIGIQIRQFMGKNVKIFLDCKFFDIPNTVAAASRAVTRMGIKMFNVHTLGGIDMMKAAVDASKDEAYKIGIPPPLILGVSLLTSIDKRIMNNELQINGSIKSQVVHLAKLADEAGLDGIIASPLELNSIKRNTRKDMLIVTPGIRPKWASADDQKRFLTPIEAIQLGATYIVIGRPITSPPSEIGTPLNAIMTINKEIINSL